MEDHEHPAREATTFLGKQGQFWVFELKDGGDVAIPPDQVRRLWNAEQLHKARGLAWTTTVAKLTAELAASRERAEKAEREFCDAAAQSERSRQFIIAAQQRTKSAEQSCDALYAKLRACCDREQAQREVIQFALGELRELRARIVALVGSSQ